MKRVKIKLPTRNQIKQYWKYKILEIKNNIFDSLEIFESGDYCFACGILTNNMTERAHIKARSIGGCDTVENIHLLCSACHKSSEMIDGDEYFEWLKKRTHVDTFLDMAYKCDYKLFRDFHNQIDNVKSEGTDVYSKDFLDKFNIIRSYKFVDDNTR